MADTFSQIYIQVVFAVQGRNSLIRPEWEEEFYKYITGVVKGKDQKLIAINGVPDHIHFLIGMKPTCCLSDLVREVKKASNEFITEKRFTQHKFNWQKGFGAFSYGQSQLNNVVNYIMNQKEHHRKQTFRDEYMGLLRAFDIQFEENYLFDWVDERE